MKSKHSLILVFSMAATTAGSLAHADGFNPSQFAADQAASMQAEQQAYTSAATQSIQDLQNFLKKNGVSTQDNNKKAWPYSSSAPSTYQAAPVKQSEPATQSNQATQHPNNLPLNVNDSQQPTNWNYKL